jgi:hypothetical protein
MAKVARPDHWNTPGDRTVSQELQRDAVGATNRTQHVNFWIYFPLVALALAVLGLIALALGWI